ncbi:MAG TPA: hypothetical protein VLJ21_04985 [Candidatus Binatia bacterium]|nr:hypothetical protein [Candidatus Binatia bacterium]
MSYEVVWKPLALKFLKSLPPLIATRIHEKIGMVSEDPFRYVGKFQGPFHKLRIGSYRALVMITPEKNLLEIELLDKRENIY